MDAVQKTLENKNNTKNIIKYSLVLLVFIWSPILSTQNDGPSKFPKVVTDKFTFTAWVNDGEDYLKKNYRWITKIIASYIKEGYYVLEDFLIDSPWLLIAAILFFTVLNCRGFKVRLVLNVCSLFLGCCRDVGRVNADLSFDGIISFFVCYFLELFSEFYVLKVTGLIIS